MFYVSDNPLSHYNVKIKSCRSWQSFMQGDFNFSFCTSHYLTQCLLLQPCMNFVHSGRLEKTDLRKNVSQLFKMFNLIRKWFPAFKSYFFFFFFFFPCWYYYLRNSFICAIMTLYKLLQKRIIGQRKTWTNTSVFK